MRFDVYKSAVDLCHNHEYQEFVTYYQVGKFDMFPTLQSWDTINYAINRFAKEHDCERIEATYHISVLIQELMPKMLAFFEGCI